MVTLDRVFLDNGQEVLQQLNLARDLTLVTAECPSDHPSVSAFILPD